MEKWAATSPPEKKQVLNSHIDKHLLIKTRETGQKDLGEEFFTTYQIPKRNVNIELSVNLLLVAS